MAFGKVLTVLTAASFLLAVPAFSQTPEQHFKSNPQSAGKTPDSTSPGVQSSGTTKSDLKSGRSESGPKTSAEPVGKLSK